MVLSNLTVMGKVGLGMFVLGVVFFMVGFSVPYWVVRPHDIDDIHVGLWQICDSHMCLNTLNTDFIFFDRDGPPGWFMGTQALACLTLIALIADVIVRLLYLCGRPKSYLLGSIITDCAACALSILAAIVFGSKMEDYHVLKLHFGFAFDILGGVFFGIAAVFFVIEYRRRS